MSCAPLNVENRCIGIINIISRDSKTYSAADLKLLNAIALQAAPAIDSAMFHQKQMEEARLREEKLQQQVRELRIEIDETKLRKQVKEVTDILETERFKDLKKKAEEYRKVRSQRIKT